MGGQSTPSQGGAELFPNPRGGKKRWERCVWMLKNWAEWTSGHGQTETVGPSDGKGQGIPQDYVQAHMWFNLAASRLPPGTSRDKAVKNRDVLAAKMTPADVSKAQRLAREWKPKK